MLLLLLLVTLRHNNMQCVSHERICSDSGACCHPEIGVPDPTCYLIHSQSTDIGPIICHCFSSSTFQAISLGFTILGEIFAYVIDF